MKILVRLPNWLGDMVMSIGFLNALKQVYPDAFVSVIGKKGIHALLEFFPVAQHQFIFSKEDYPGIAGAWRFGRQIYKQGPFDVFFSLPDSFSSALMGLASGAKKRVGYKKELRSVLFTHTYTKKSAHRVEEYIDLLQQFSKHKVKEQDIRLSYPAVAKKNLILININSEAKSRRLPVQKAVDLIMRAQQNFSDEIVLIGGKQDMPYVSFVTNMIADKTNVANLAGKTSLPELVELIATAKLVLTTDSGPAHLANALGTHTLVLFGAGNEHNTAPFNKNNLSIIRYGKLACEPCVKNVCVLYGTPKCLELIDEKTIIDNMLRIVPGSEVPGSGFEV